MLWARPGLVGMALSIFGSAMIKAEVTRIIPTARGPFDQRLGVWVAPSRRCYAVLLLLFRYRYIDFIDFFLFRQAALVDCCFKNPEKALRQNVWFNFRDAFTRELSVNLVAALNDPDRFGLACSLRRPLFDVERAEVPANPEAKVRVVVGKGVASLEIAPGFGLPLGEWRVAQALRQLAAEGPAALGSLYPLFALDQDNPEILERISEVILAGSLPGSQVMASEICHKLEQWSCHASRALAAVGSIHQHYRRNLAERHSAKAASARLERLLPASLLSERTKAWRRMNSQFNQAAHVLRAHFPVSTTGLKQTVMEILDRPASASALALPVRSVLDAAYRRAIAQVLTKASRTGRWAKADEQAILERFGAPESRRAHLFGLNAFLIAINGERSIASLPERDLEVVVIDRTARLLAADLADWLGVSTPQTVSLDAIRHAL